MAGAIIGLGAATAQNPAPTHLLGELYNLLNGNTPKFFVINGYGEALGPAPFKPFGLTGYGSIVEYVDSGAIFIDYCGWPLYYLVDIHGNVSIGSPSHWQTFASQIGYSWLDQETFATQPGGSPEYPFYRGYRIVGAQNGVYLPHGTFEQYGVSWALNAAGNAAMIGLHKPGHGWYFYGTYFTNAFVETFGAFGNPVGVPIATYAAFILACLNGETSGPGFTISHEPYSIPYQTQAPPVSAPASPFQSSPGPSGASSSSSSPSGISTSTQSSSSPSSNSSVQVVPSPIVKSGGPPYVLPIGIGLGAASVGGLAYWWWTK